jgi:hypothetical protein
MKSLPLLIIVLGVSNAFTIQSRSQNARNVELNACNTRRNFVQGAVALNGWTLLTTRPVFADVSDGNALPKGAAQFSRLVNTRNNVKIVEKRVAQKASEIDQKEWDNIGGFIRKLYGAGDDMKDIAKGIYDPEKKAKAEDDIKQLQKYAKAAEGPVNKKDAEAFVAVMNKCEDLLDNFFELLQDVPDEI